MAVFAGKDNGIGASSSAIPMFCPEKIPRVPPVTYIIKEFGGRLELQ